MIKNVQIGDLKKCADWWLKNVQIGDFKNVQIGD